MSVLTSPCLKQDLSAACCCMNKASCPVSVWRVSRLYYLPCWSSIGITGVYYNALIYIGHKDMNSGHPAWLESFSPLRFFCVPLPQFQSTFQATFLAILASYVSPRFHLIPSVCGVLAVFISLSPPSSHLQWTLSPYCLRFGSVIPFSTMDLWTSQSSPVPCDWNCPSFHWEFLLSYRRGYSRFDFVKKKCLIHCHLSKLFVQLNMFWFLRCLIFYKGLRNHAQHFFSNSDFFFLF